MTEDNWQIIGDAKAFKDFLAQMETHKIERGIGDPPDIEPCEFSPTHAPHPPKTWPDGSYCDGYGTVYAPNGSVYPKPCPCLMEARGRDNQGGYLNHVGLEIRTKVRHANESQYACKDLFETWHPGKSPGVYLIGPSGVGKTIAGHRAVLKMISALALGGYYISARHVATDCSLLATDGNERYRAEERLTRHLFACRGRSIVMLDDLGRERHSDATAQRMSEYLELLYERRAPCAITTNLAGIQIGERYGTDILSRLCDASWLTPIVCEGKDLRRPKNAPPVEPRQETHFQTEEEIFADMGHRDCAMGTTEPEQGTVEQRKDPNQW